MRAQHFAQSRMDKMRRRVIASRRIARVDIDFGSDRVADFERAFFDLDLVNDQALDGRVGISHARDVARASCAYLRSSRRALDDRADISNLAAALGIERRLIEHDAAFIAFTSAQTLRHRHE